MVAVVVIIDEASFLSLRCKRFPSHQCLPRKSWTSTGLATHSLAVSWPSSCRASRLYALFSPSNRTSWSTDLPTQEEAVAAGHYCAGVTIRTSGTTFKGKTPSFTFQEQN